MDWPTAPTRHGGSRRDTLRRFVGGVVAVGAVLAGLALLALDRAAPERAAGLRGAFADAVAPIWAAAARPATALRDTVGRAGAYLDAVERARRLEGELARARADGLEAGRLAAENARLKRLIALREPTRRRVAVGRIAGASAAGPVESAIITVGAADGVRTGQPVLNDAGLIGRVTDVGRNAARLVLVSDRESRVPVRVARTGVAGLLAGAGGGMATLGFIEGPDGPGTLRVGDRLLTSGEGGVFAPEVPVAVIVALGGDAPLARPLARPSALGFAVVEAAWLPPVPAAAPPPPGPALAAAR